ncbi:hypothetical protein AAHC03_013660 [Spirometra sp. Aus1]
MFHQIRVPKTQRSLLRFLWWPNGDLARELEVYQMAVHPFGATSSPCLAIYALNRLIDRVVDFPSAHNVNYLRKCFYVDDGLISRDSKQALRDVASHLRAALQTHGFRLHKWRNNSVEALADIPEEERVDGGICLDLKPADTHRTLGVEWNNSTDSFRFTVKWPTETITRRTMLSYISTLYDPLGFVAPVLLPAKLLLQQLCRSNLGWDDRIDAEHARQWFNWTKQFQGLSNVRIQRCLTPVGLDIVEQYQLHGFSDASNSGYGAVVYLHAVIKDGTTFTTFVWGKSRVAPLKVQTIPRLELTAAVLVVKLVKQAELELTLPISSKTMWTDSMVVLQLIRNTTSRLETFVANRISTILGLSDPSQWRYVNSETNPADVASRGVAGDWLEKSMWLTGPVFLSKKSDEWPKEPDQRPVVVTKICDATVNAVLFENHWLTELSGCGSWRKLLRLVAWLRRFQIFLKNKVSHQPEVVSKQLTVADLAGAECDILRLVQRQFFENGLK